MTHAQDIGTDAIWPVQHIIRAPRGPDLIHALKVDPGLLLRVAAALQVLSLQAIDAAMDAACLDHRSIRPLVRELYGKATDAACKNHKGNGPSV